MPNGDRDRRQDSGHVPFRIGPGLLVTAAFIGPGTVVTASKAGAERGCGLLWTIVFACVGTIVLQSLAARVGIASGNGLGESIRKTLQGSRWLRPAILLVIAAIGIGNAAYQTGNLTGAAAGIRVIAGGSAESWIVILVACTCSLLLIGRYRVLHASLVAMVVLLSLAFLCTAALSLPAATRIAIGIAIPRFGVEDLTLVLALIGTTIVPYNLFLHASSAASTWKGEPMRESIIQSDWDTTISVGLGGVVTASILITASSAFFDTQTPWTSAGDIGQQLKPTLGSASATAFAIGLFAAGLTSSITAPLATAYAVCGCLGWSTDASGRRFRAISLGIVVCGGAFALAMGKSPTATIIFAQLANGLLLPFIAVFLLMAATRAVDRPNLMLGKVRLRLAQLVLAGVVLLGLWRIAAVFA
jgi:NRAMP (natural resistance-associated macrophage protein)-like metal ion transporter